VKLSTGDESVVKVTIRKFGSATYVAQLTVTATQNGDPLFGTTQLVQQMASNGREVFEFAVMPIVLGDVVWSATILDADPDVDFDSSSTTVVP
jgi:hypothetical protein